MSAKIKDDEKKSDGQVFTIVRGERNSVGGHNANANDNDKENENAWVFESLVGFLTGPIWNSTMMTFLEHKSIVFDPSQEEQDTEDEYRKIHEEYRNLVDLMLNSFTQDLGITAEQFEQACSQANGDIVSSQLQKTLFDQIWAAEDYTVFVHMMIQKNTELQLQALEFLKRRGVSFDIDTIDLLDDKNSSQFGQTHPQSAVHVDHSEIKQVSTDSVVVVTEERVTVESDERQKHETENEAEQKILQKATIKLSLESESEPSVVVVDETKRKIKVQEIEQPQSSQPSVRKITTLGSTTNNDTRRQSQDISPEELAKRQTYLRQQRDKLLALKQKKRIKELDERPASDPSRPRSSSMARSVLDGGSSGDFASAAVGGAGQSPIDSGILAARRALVTRLKTEVIENK